MRILVIEDNRDIAENLADYLEPRGHVLDFAYDGVTGLHLAVTNPYDVIVLDLMLPAMGGLAVCRKLREEARVTTPVLMLTARDQVCDKLEGFRAGTDDYVVKPFSLEELEARLSALHRRGEGRTAGRTLQVADLEFDPDTLVARRGGRTLDLNPTSRCLLQVLMENSHRVVRRAELEQALWGDDPPEGDVLRTHIHALRTVVDRPFPSRLIHTIHGAGYRLSAPDEE